MIGVFVLAASLIAFGVAYWPAIQQVIEQYTAKKGR
jgi:hypothetical protein